MRAQLVIFSFLYLFLNTISLANLKAIVPIPFDSDVVTVLEKDLDAPLPGVIVYNTNRTFTGATDVKGQIIIKGLPDTDSLFFDFAGFTPLVKCIQDIKNNYNKVFLTQTAIKLDEFVVLGNSKFAERSQNIPSIVKVVESKDIILKNPQTSADMLENTGSIFIQKSQMGGGSPVIRGFEANKLLIVIDGVRMNNAIYRNGHLQNVISIDNGILERTEVIFGPASVIYGSDALGGVMHFFTRTPRLHDKDDKKKFEINASTRYSSANFEKSGHIDLNYGNEKWGILTSVSGGDFDALRSGSVKSKHHPEGYGDRTFYTDRKNAADSVYRNENPRYQLGTAYQNFDIVQKIRYQPTDSVKLMLNFQYSTTSNVPRYDQLTEGTLDTLDGVVSKDFKFSDWDYGPQQRMMVSLSGDFKSKSKFFNTAKLLFAYQKVDEDRITRRYGLEWRNFQKEDVHVGSFNADFSKDIVPNKFKLLYGAEFTYNKVVSSAFQRHIATGEIEDRSVTRYPDGGSHMLSFAAYLSGQLKVGKKINVIGGLRQTYITLTSNFLDTAFFNLPESRAFLNTSALTGGLGLTWKPLEGYNVHAVVSSAFRAPNVDDFGKVRSKGGYVTIPNPELVAEKTLNAEITLSKNFNDKVKIGGTYFYTYLFDVLVRRNDSLGTGDLTLYFDGGFDTIQRNFNAGEGFIYGLSGNVLVQLMPNLKLQSIINFTKGYNISDDRPLSHIPPIYGSTSIAYTHKEVFSTEFVAKYNGWKRKNQYDIEGSDNFEKATENGTPPWYTLNLYTSCTLKKNYTLTFGVENILDKHYRPFSSGVSAPGINFIVSLRGRF